MVTVSVATVGWPKKPYSFVGHIGDPVALLDTALWDRVTLKTEEQRSGGVADTSLTITNSDCGQQQPMVLDSGEQQTIVRLNSGQADIVVGAGSRIPSLPNEEITPVNHVVGISAAFCQRNCREATASSVWTAGSSRP